MKPDKQRNTGSNNNKRNLMGIASILLWALVVTILVNYFLSMSNQANSTLIQYSEFSTLVEEDKVYAVSMTSNKFTIYLKEDVAAVGLDPEAIPPSPLRHRKMTASSFPASWPARRAPPVWSSSSPKPAATTAPLSMIPACSPFCGSTMSGSARLISPSSPLW